MFSFLSNNQGGKGHEARSARWVVLAMIENSTVAASRPLGESHRCVSDGVRENRDGKKNGSSRVFGSSRPREDDAEYQEARFTWAALWRKTDSLFAAEVTAG